MEIDLKTLANFIVEYKKYHSWTSGTKITEDKGSCRVAPFEIRIKDTVWRFTDDFIIGKEDRIFQGLETAVCMLDMNNEEWTPVWAMSYRGEYRGTEKEKGTVNDILKQALKAVPVDAPFRGPKELLIPCDEKNKKSKAYAYRNSWQGRIGNFEGEEHIKDLISLRTVHSLKYFGGLIK